ncbi:MAG: TCR/Tet family MFS transporter [Myxococcaceae bacterium]|nr:TCR/Tet family MFS transporter [Myxococcaceae bacterium]
MFSIRPQGRRAAFVFIFITVLLDLIALGMIIPVFPSLLLGFEGGDTERTAKLIGLFTTVFALMQFLFSPLFGALSDRYGRRPVVLLSNFGLGFDYLVMALAPTLSWLFVGRIVSGITSASVPTAYAYVADTAAPEERPKYFGFLGVAFGVGFILGPFVGGVAGHFDPRLPFFLSAGLSLLNGLYGLFVLPESLPKERRAQFRWSRANPVGSLVLLSSKKQLLGLAAVTLFADFAHVVLPTVFVLYAQYRYNWGEFATGLMMGVVGLCSMIVQGALVGPVIQSWGERRALLFALVMGGAGFVLFAFASTPWLFILGVPVMSLWGLANPAIQGLMTRKVGPSEQGQLQGANQSLMAVAELVGPSMFSFTFAWFISADAPLRLPGAPFLLATAFLVMAGGLAAWVTRGASRDASPPKAAGPTQPIPGEAA